MISFDSATHTYTNEKGEGYVSVTTLLQKYGIAPSYSEVPAEVLKQAADRGTEIHRQIEAYYDSYTAPEWSEAQKGASLLDERFKGEPVMEQTVYSDEWKIAGRYDCLFGDALVDIKTSAEIHTQSYAWQLSIYAFIIEKMTGREVKSLWILHLPKEQYGEPKLIDFTSKRIPSACILELLQANLMKQPYAPPIPKVELKKTEEQMLADWFVLDAKLKEMEKQSKAIKEKIYQYMLENDIEKAESQDGRITIVLKKPYQSARVDSARLKSEFPDVYLAVTKTSEVKGNITIKVKED